MAVCGRFYVDDDEQDEGVRAVFPTDTFDVVTATSPGVSPMRWGFPMIKGKGVLINARAETAEQKPTFVGALTARRAVVPANGFFEWEHDDRGRPTKNRFRIARADGERMRMAALYDEENRFVIVTRAANSDLAPLHDRMPLILPSPEAESLWLRHENIAKVILACDFSIGLSVFAG